MKSIKNLIAISAFGLLVLGLPAIASAQYGGRNDPYNRNGGYNNGGNGNNGYYGDTRSIVRDLKSRSKDLQRQLDRELDNSRYNGSRREDQINQLAKDFKDAASHLSESNNGRDDRNVDRVLQLGSELDRSLSRSGMSYGVQNIWSGIRNDMQALGYSGGNNNNNRNNRNNRYPQGGNGRSNRPSWWPF